MATSEAAKAEAGEARRRHLGSPTSSRVQSVQYWQDLDVVRVAWQDGGRAWR